MDTITGDASKATMTRIREVKPRSQLVKREWICANGSREVELHDDTEAGWERYCAEVVARSQKGARRARAQADEGPTDSKPQGALADLDAEIEARGSARCNTTTLRSEAYAAVQSAAARLEAAERRYIKRLYREDDPRFEAGLEAARARYLGVTREWNAAPAKAGAA